MESKPKWADELTKEFREFKTNTTLDIAWLKDQAAINSSKLETTSKRIGLLPEMYELVKANGKNTESIAQAPCKQNSY